MDRRAFLRGAILAAPAVILTPGLLMPVRSLTALDDLRVLTAAEIHAYEVQQAILFGRYITQMLTPPDRMWLSLVAVIKEHDYKK